MTFESLTQNASCLITNDCNTSNVEFDFASPNRVTSASGMQVPYRCLVPADSVLGPRCTQLGRNDGWKCLGSYYALSRI